VSRRPSDGAATVPAQGSAPTHEAPPAPADPSSGARRADSGVVVDDDSVVVSVRSRPAVHSGDTDDEVVTSAVPLEALRRKPAERKPPPPPPPPPRPRMVSTPSETKPVVPEAVAAGAPVAAPEQHAPPPPPPPAPPVAPQETRGRLATSTASVPAKKVAPALASTPPPQIAAERRSVGGVPLDQIDLFADLSHEVQALVASRCQLETLAADEEINGFEAAAVLEGGAIVCARIVDAPAHRALTGALVPSRGSLDEGAVALRVVAGPEGAKVAVWRGGVLEDALKALPWIWSPLRERADRLQALAGSTMGPLGDLDETYRNFAVERLVVRVLQPHEVLVEKGDAPAGIVVVGAGEMVLVDGETVGEIGPGDFLFGGAVLQGLPSPATARAGASGALLLVGDRKLAHELLVTVPPLVELLGT